jgi:cephalosporin hydroxylase
MDQVNKLLKKFPASQNPEELSFLTKELLKITTQVIFEVGIHQGYSLAIWKELCPQADVIGIDNDLHALDKKATKDCIIIDDSSHLSSALGALERHLQGRKIDFLFIDGDHTEPGVKMDYNRFAPYVRDGGLIAFHDVTLKDNPGVQVYKFWDELKIKDGIKFEEITGKNGTGTGIIYK